jgi:hypothetical protein
MWTGVEFRRGHIRPKQTEQEFSDYRKNLSVIHFVLKFFTICTRTARSLTPQAEFPVLLRPHYLHFAFLFPILVRTTKCPYNYLIAVCFRRPDGYLPSPIRVLRAIRGKKKPPFRPILKKNPVLNP